MKMKKGKMKSFLEKLKNCKIPTIHLAQSNRMTMLLKKTLNKMQIQISQKIEKAITSQIQTKVNSNYLMKKAE
jgi:hypothetical protein